MGRVSVADTSLSLSLSLSWCCRLLAASSLRRGTLPRLAGHMGRLGLSCPSMGYSRAVGALSASSSAIAERVPAAALRCPDAHVDDATRAGQQTAGSCNAASAHSHRRPRPLLASLTVVCSARPGCGGCGRPRPRRRSSTQLHIVNKKHLRPAFAAPAGAGREAPAVPNHSITAPAREAGHKEEN